MFKVAELNLRGCAIQNCSVRAGFRILEETIKTLLGQTIKVNNFRNVLKRVQEIRLHFQVYPQNELRKAKFSVLRGCTYITYALCLSK